MLYLKRKRKFRKDRIESTMHMKRIDFENGTITGNILGAALPMLVAQILNLLYNIVDRIYIARIPEIGTAALGAVGLCFPIIVIITAFSNLFGTGGAPLFSIFRGKKDPDTARRIMNTSFTMLCVCAMVLMAVGFLFARPILILFGASAEAIIYAYPYMMLYLIGTLPSMIAVGMNPFINAQGYSSIGMLSVAIGAGTNLVLDPLFIFALGLGVRGAAIATVIGQISALLLYIIVYRRNSYAVHISFKHLVFDKAIIRQIYSVGIPSTVMMLLPSILISVLNSILTAFSDVYVAVLGVYFKLQTFIYMPANGIVQGMRPIIGYNYGAGESSRVKSTIRYSLLTAAGLMLTGTILALALPKQILALFDADAALMSAGVTALRIISLGFLVSSVGLIYSGVFEAIGNGRNSLIISLLRQFVITIPLSFILTRFFGPTGVWISFPVGELCASAAAFCLLKKYQNGAFSPL